MSAKKKLGMAAPLTLAASPGGDGKLPRFELVAYTGGVIKPYGWWQGVVVDLAGVEIPSEAMPLRFAHRSGWADGVGHTERCRIADGQLTASGVVSRETEAAREVVRAAANGFPWQASIGADVLEVEFVREGITTTVNGRQVAGPIDIVRRCRLFEISVVDVGADTDTEVAIAATGDGGRGVMAGERNDQTPAVPPAGTQTSPATPPAATPPIQAGAATSPPPEPHPDPVATLRASLAAETERAAAVRRICAGRNDEIEARAIREGWDATRTELEVLRAGRAQHTGVATGHGQALTPRVLEAALCQAGRLDRIEASFDAQTLEAAHSRFRGRIGLQELFLEAAWANGYAGRTFRQDPRGVLQAAFSTRDISGILSNVANKFLLQGWMGVEMAWRRIAATRPVNDFKTVTSYRLIGDDMYEKVGPDGEIKHGTLGEQSYTNRADTYAKLLSVTRQDQINDDMGALTTAPKKLGRGSALKVNDVFWTEFMNNAAFFAAGNANYIAGATAGITTESRLSIDGLARARLTFLNQTDTESKPLGVEPRLLLVPPALETTAWQLLNSLEVRDTTASTKAPTGNPHAGRYQSVVSTYLSNAAYAGNSALAWYLLADPEDLPVIEVVFLNGQETPTIETADADFGTLGVQMRGYHDFGAGKQEYRGGVKAKGEA